MGYTLVMTFDEMFVRKLNRITGNIKTNKIPFGRQCNRIIADQIIKYHMTLFHWAKKFDSVYLPRVEQLRFDPFEIIITGTELLYAEEGSMLLYFSVSPGRHYEKAMNQIRQAMKTELSSFLHITIAVSKEQSLILNLKRILDEQFCFPFCVEVTELNLYHIWEPVTLERIISAEV